MCSACAFACAGGAFRPPPPAVRAPPRPAPPDPYHTYRPLFSLTQALAECGSRARARARASHACACGQAFLRSGSARSRRSLRRSSTSSSRSTTPPCTGSRPTSWCSLPPPTPPASISLLSVALPLSPSLSPCLPPPAPRSLPLARFRRSRSLPSSSCPLGSLVLPLSLVVFSPLSLSSIPCSLLSAPSPPPAPHFYTCVPPTPACSRVGRPPTLPFRRPPPGPQRAAVRPRPSPARPLHSRRAP